MTETKRTAAQIRAYCEAATEEPWQSMETMIYARAKIWTPQNKRLYRIAQVEVKRDNAEENVDFVVNARTDLPRVLDVAVKLREALEYCWCVMRTVPSGITKVYRETAWLADSPEAPVSPDGENGEESEK